MERHDIDRLRQWKESKNRKPLILNGIRQVGKTWLLKEFGKRQYKNTVYINFEEQPEFRQFFETTKDTKRILENLSAASGQPILPADTLLIFDEIQECPQALTTLKYFYENVPDYHITAAGSLLGITLSKPASFPVGKVDFMEIRPMTFSEFLRADGSANLADVMERIETPAPLPDAFFNPLTEKLKLYFLTGGMPEAVLSWSRGKDIEEVQKALKNILTAYERDFAKHMTPKDYPKAAYLWRSVPSQLAKENKKFIYRVVKEGARAREYEDALQWLIQAKLVYKIYRSSAPGLPLSAYDDLSAFKLYFPDVGLLRRQALLDPSAFREGNRLFTEFKGALTENYILEALVNQTEAMPRYWTTANPGYEVDFLIQLKNYIIPVEVKSDANVESRSLKVFRAKYGEAIPLSVRYSLKNLLLDGDVLNIPLFMADYSEKLILHAVEMREGGE